LFLGSSLFSIEDFGSIRRIFGDGNVEGEFKGSIDLNFVIGIVDNLFGIDNLLGLGFFLGFSVVVRVLELFGGFGVDLDILELLGGIGLDLFDLHVLLDLLSLLVEALDILVYLLDG